MRSLLKEGHADQLSKFIYKKAVPYLKRYAFEAAKHDVRVYTVERFKVYDAEKSTNITVTLYFQKIDWQDTYADVNVIVQGKHLNDMSKDTPGVTTEFETYNHEIRITSYFRVGHFGRSDINRLLAEAAAVIRHECEHYMQYAHPRTKSDRYIASLHAMLQYMYSSRVKITSGKYAGEYGKIIEVLGTRIKLELTSLHKKQVILNKSSLSGHRSFFDYMVSLLEVPAHVVGFMRLAKILKQPFGKVIREKLFKEYTAVNLTDAERNLIYRIYMEYAKKKYPNVATHI